MARKIEILDTTLRDGAQAHGISFSLEDKIAVISTLSSLGIPYIEVGSPFSNPKDKQLIEYLRQRKISDSRLTVFGSTRRKDADIADDSVIATLLEENVGTVTVFGKSWKLHVSEILMTSLNENLSMIYDSVHHLKEQGIEVIYDAEHFFDGYIDDPEYAMSTLDAAYRAGADCLTLCDTNGGSLVEDIYDITKAVTKRFPDIKIGIHCHDDLGLAVAGSIAAVRAGATLVQGTLIGFGERCGNASLSAIIPTLMFKYGYDCIDANAMPHLTHTTRKVAEIANISLVKFAPYVGANAFAHKAGMHADGILKNPRSFEHINPESVGNHRKLLTSEMSGRHAVIAKVNKFAPHLTKDSDEIHEILGRLKQLEQDGYSFEAADASFELFVRRFTNLFTSHFELIHYKTVGELPYNDSMPSSAVVELKVGEETAVNSAGGSGPLHALDSAARKTLYPFYPRLNESYMCDYKVRVLNSEAATAAKVRVLMTTTDGRNVWSTVGVSTDVIEASWIALVDAIEYKLLLDERQ